MKGQVRSILFTTISYVDWLINSKHMHVLMCMNINQSQRQQSGPHFWWRISTEFHWSSIQTLQLVAVNCIIPKISNKNSACNFWAWALPNCWGFHAPFHMEPTIWMFWMFLHEKCKPHLQAPSQLMLCDCNVGGAGANLSKRNADSQK